MQSTFFLFFFFSPTLANLIQSLFIRVFIVSFMHYELAVGVEKKKNKKKVIEETTNFRRQLNRARNLMLNESCTSLISWTLSVVCIGQMRRIKSTEGNLEFFFRIYIMEKCKYFISYIYQPLAAASENFGIKDTIETRLWSHCITLRKNNNL